MLLKILNDQLLTVHYEYYFNVTQFSSSSTNKSNKTLGAQSYCTHIMDCKFKNETCLCLGYYSDPTM